MDGAEEGAASGGGMSHKECVARINKSLAHPTVRFLREKMEQAGCPAWARLLTAITCKGRTSVGGYASGRGITICCNHVTFQDEINQVIIHELIHAYDDCRAKNMDWTNCSHHACSEIRANHLSGDCHYKRELLRGFMKIRGHEQTSKGPSAGGVCKVHYELLWDAYLLAQEKGIVTGSVAECVRRRSLKSVQSNPHCSDVAAKDAIEAVWDICYKDTSPFDRAP